jgi:hypothetical protein
VGYFDERDMASAFYREPEAVAMSKSSALRVAFRPIAKGASTDGYQRVVTGVVLEPTLELGQPDSQNDVYSKADVEAAAYSFAEKGHFQIGLQHTTMASATQAHVLESWIQRGDAAIGGQPVVDGTWLISLRLDPETFSKVLDGSFSGFSIGGIANRSPLGGVS